MGTKQEKVMIGVFHTVGEARRAIEDLRDAGFSDKKIGVLTHDKEGDPEVKSFRDLEGNKAKAGAAIGAAAGASGPVDCPAATSSSISNRTSRQPSSCARPLIGTTSTLTFRSCSR